MNRMNVVIANVYLQCRFQFSETNKSFYEFQALSQKIEHQVSSIIGIEKSDWDYYKKLGFLYSPHMEYSLLTAYFSDALITYDRVIVHGVAIRWQDKAYLICANPGVGKSTQAHFLQELRPGEFGVICGDRPVLQFCHSERSAAKLKIPSSSSVKTGQTEDQIIVHPSPWNGKEDWHGADAAPLAGLILLERGEENSLAAISERDAILPMYSYFIQTAISEENVKKIAQLETRLLRSVPIWKLTTHDVPASTRLLLEAVFTH